MNWFNEISDIFDSKSLKRDFEQSRIIWSNEDRELIDITNSSVIKILIWEYEIIHNIIEQILWNLDIENRMTMINIRFYLEKYINEKTSFYYDKDNKNIVWVVLDEIELKELLNKIHELILADKRLTIKWWIEERKKSKYEDLSKRKTQRNEILKRIDTLKQELYRTESTLYRLQDKWSNTLTIENDKSVVQNKIKIEEDRIIELDEAILNIEAAISFLNEKVTDLKTQEASFDIKKYSKLLDFNISDYIPEKKPWILIDCEKDFLSGILKKWKKIVYPLSILIWLWLSVKLIHENNKNNLIMQQYSESFNNQKLIEEKKERKRVEKLANIFPKYIEWFEQYKVTNIEKWWYDLVYKWDTPGRNIYILEINIYYKKNWETIIDNRGFYFYEKDLNNSEYCMLIKNIDDTIGIVGNLKIEN